MTPKKAFERWTTEDSSDLYHIKSWGSGYFDISPEGTVKVMPIRNKSEVSINLMDVVNGIRARGMQMPVLLRIENILDSQIYHLHDSFRSAMEKFNYKGAFRGVYPIKVNQQQQVVEEITSYGAQFHHGLEAGSKAELIAALSLLKDKSACLICNGYKDEEFIDLGLYACKMGFQCILVIEMLSELDLILARSKELKIRPLLGVRFKLSTRAEGHWTDSGGEQSIFGLNINQIIQIVDVLKSKDMLDCLKLLHYHLGSQIPNIRHIRASVSEACRVYAGLAAEGASMTYLDVGGGLAVDYIGSHTNFTSSRNYTLKEYCEDIIEAIMEITDEKGIPHPTIITESGRATVAYYSVLLFNILEVSQFETYDLPEEMPVEHHEIIDNLMEVYRSLQSSNINECFNDAMYYRDQVRQLFNHGEMSLRERAMADKIFWQIVHSISEHIQALKFVPPDLKDLSVAMADIYYGNFSLFQSLPDSWAIDQMFPIMPIHRLNEYPARKGILADITCDCDGKIDQFVDLNGIRRTLPLHELKSDEEYYLGVFLVGAYQETLGDLHNLFGDTNVVSIRVEENGDYRFVRELEGDSVSDVLTYVEYDPKRLREQFRKTAEQAIKEKKITPQERPKVLNRYEKGLRGSTYFKR